MLRSGAHNGVNGYTGIKGDQPPAMPKIKIGDLSRTLDAIDLNAVVIPQAHIVRPKTVVGLAGGLLQVGNLFG